MRVETSLPHQFESLLSTSSSPRQGDKTGERMARELMGWRRKARLAGFMEVRNGDFNGSRKWLLQSDCMQDEKAWSELLVY